jgi:hypothetical protein
MGVGVFSKGYGNVKPYCGTELYSFAKTSESYT